MLGPSVGVSSLAQRRVQRPRRTRDAQPRSLGFPDIEAVTDEPTELET
jgi:hypothetical protein